MYVGNDQMFEAEENIFNQLDRIKDDIVEKMSFKWKDFKQYGRKVRKNYLGDQKQQTFSSFPLHEVKELIQLMEIKSDSLFEFVELYEEKSSVMKQKIREEATGHQEKESIHSSKKTIISAFPEISPIKPNLRQGPLITQMAGVQLQKHLELKENMVISPVENQEDQAQPSRKFKTQFRQEEINPKRTQLKLKESRSVRELFPSPEMSVKKDHKSPPLSGTRNTSPIFTALQNIQAIQSPKYLMESKIKKSSKMVGVFKPNLGTFGSQNATKRRQEKDGGSTRRQDGSLNKGYRFCIEQLQRQQKEYERIKRGLQ